MKLVFESKDGILKESEFDEGMSRKISSMEVRKLAMFEVMVWEKSR